MNYIYRIHYRENYDDEDLTHDVDRFDDEDDEMYLQRAKGEAADWLQSNRTHYHGEVWLGKYYEEEGIDFSSETKVLSAEEETRLRNELIDLRAEHDDLHQEMKPTRKRLDEIAYQKSRLEDQLRSYGVKP